MFKWILFALVSVNLFALELSIQGAKENFKSYSTLHIKDTNPFLCQEIKNDFNKVTQIVCAFSKRPDKKIHKLQNNFFLIDTLVKKRTYFVTITPFKRVKLFPMIFDLSKEDTFFQADVKLSKHWMIVGYDEKLPYIEKKIPSDTQINLPYTSREAKLPFVGGLDIKGNPVHIKKIGDVSEYLQIKEYYKQGRYNLTLELVDEVILNYPNSLFMAELLFYKIRVFSKLKDYDNVIEVAKIFLKEYSADENIPEVLSLTAQAYAKIGLDSDADYFFDRLFSEHQDSPYAKWGFIYKAEMFEASGADSKALTYYLKALNETKDIDIAATAAYKLASFHISKLDKSKSSEYIMKIIKAKPSFFMNDMFKSTEMMYTYADNGYYKTAAAIAKALLDEMERENDEYEELLKDRGIWLSKTDEKQEALDSLNEYLKKFTDGEYNEEISVAKDSLFFNPKDENLTTRLKNYDELMQKYNGDSIGDKAIYEKAKLLEQNKMYGDVLGFKESILSLESSKYPDTKKIIRDSAIGVMKDALKQKECYRVLNISKDYNITLSNDWDDGIYTCAMKGADFTLAKSTASRNLKSKDLQERKKWLYRYIKVDFATGNYSEVVEASKELIVLIEDTKDKKYKDVYRILFDTYQRLEENDKMIQTIAKIEKEYKLTYKDIERYIAVMAIGSSKNDDNMVINYASKVMQIQTASDSYAQSPFVEFTIYQSFINKEEYLKALDVIKSLDTLELTPNQRARQKYLLGSVYSKLWRNDESLKAYDESVKADPKSAWAKLAESAKEL